MAIANLSKIDQNLTKMYQEQVTVNKSENYIDRSDVLLQQMTFIALNNKSFFKF